MATLLQHLTDNKWLFYERGMQHWYNWLRRIATATTHDTTGITSLGAIEVDAATAGGTAGFSAAPTAVVPNPSGQLDNKASTQIEYSSGAVPKRAPTNEQDNAGV